MIARNLDRFRAIEIDAHGSVRALAENDSDVAAAVEIVSLEDVVRPRTDVRDLRPGGDRQDRVAAFVEPFRFGGGILVADRAT